MIVFVEIMRSVHYIMLFNFVRLPVPLLLLYGTSWLSWMDLACWRWPTHGQRKGPSLCWNHSWRNLTAWYYCYMG